MADTISTEFGYYPSSIECRVGPVKVTTLPDLRDRVAEVQRYKTIDNDWLFLLPDRVSFSEGAGNRLFSLPKTHTFTHECPDDLDHIRFHIWSLSFFCGMRLSTDRAGFVDATPVRPHKLVDFSLSGSFDGVLRLAETFWLKNRHNPINAKRFGAAVHALFIAKNPRFLQFEEFFFLYTALDACFKLTQSLRGGGNVSHANRTKWMCDQYGIAPPPWAIAISGDGVEIAEMRNATFHEALFMGEPLGYALHGVNTDQNLTLEMSALICRLLIASIGASTTEYVRSPIDTQSLHSLDL